MNSGMIWTLLLSMIVLSLFGLVLLPALIELYWPKDNLPLKVVREFDGNISNFAIGFGRLIESELGSILASSVSGVKHGTLSSGEAYLLTRDGAQLLSEGGEGETFDRILVCADNSSLPDNVVFAKEVYAAGDMTCGQGTIFRAVLANGNISLGSDSGVLRWMHAKGRISVASGSRIVGRASSDSGIELSENVSFERLYAPRMEFVSGPETVQDSGPLPEWAPDDKARRVGSHWRIDGDASIPSRHACHSALVVEGTLDIGGGGWMHAAIKGKKDLRLGADCRCDDAVIAGNALEIGENCRIKGPLISESAILLKRGSIVGTDEFPTTVTAPRITVEPGVVVYGSVWAREQGKVNEST